MPVSQVLAVLLISDLINDYYVMYLSTDEVILLVVYACCSHLSGGNNNRGYPAFAVGQDTGGLQAATLLNYELGPK